LDRRNPLARYERSNVLTMLDRCEEALQELKLLGHIAPGEASVFFQVCNFRGVLVHVCWYTCVGTCVLVHVCWYMCVGTCVLAESMVGFKRRCGSSGWSAMLHLASGGAPVLY
jgi:hypothetical protein